MACGCQNKGTTLTAAGVPVGPGTFRVMVSGRQVYESAADTAAMAVGERFSTSEIHAPGGDILTFELDEKTGIKSWTVTGSWLKSLTPGE